MSSDRWSLLASVPRCHRFFQCLSTGRIAMADRSGYYPEQTDDGVLYLDRPEAGEIVFDACWQPGRRPSALVEVTREDGSKAHASLTMQEAVLLGGFMASNPREPSSPSGYP